jgi:hypothetical protein
VRPDTEFDWTGRLRILLDAQRFHFQEAEGLRRGRKLQMLTFRYKNGLRQGCIRIRSDEYHFDCGWQVL